METTEENYHVVIYTDGSCGPKNPDRYGSGVHGYIYKESDLDNKTSDRPTKINITDMGYIENEQMAKKDYRITVPSFYINGYYSFEDIGTNNIAEVKAFIDSIEDIIKQTDKHNISIKSFYVRIDSMYVINYIEKIRNDEDRKWDNDETININLLREVERVLKYLDSRSIGIRINKVAAHSTSVGNNLADSLAYFAMVQSHRGNYNKTAIIEKPRKYWTKREDKHPFLINKDLYFTNSFREPGQDISYSILSYKTDVEPGTKTADTGFGVVKLNEAPEYIEEAIRTYQKYMKTLTVISALNLDVLYHQFNSQYTKLFGTDAYTFNPRRHILKSMNGPTVIKNINPPGLAVQAMDKMTVLHEVIRDFEMWKVGKKNERKYTYTDLESYIYNRDGNSNLKCKLENGAKELKIEEEVDGKKRVFPFILGKDTLPRNQFKRIEELEPNVLLATKTIGKMIEYYCVVMCYYSYHTEKVIIQDDESITLSHKPVYHRVEKNKGFIDGELLEKIEYRIGIDKKDESGKKYIVKNKNKDNIIGKEIEVTYITEKENQDISVWCNLYNNKIFKE